MSDGKDKSRAKFLDTLLNRPGGDKIVESPYLDDELELIEEVEEVEEVELVEEEAEVAEAEEAEEQEEEQAEPASAPLPSATERKFQQMLNERHRLSRKYLGKKTRY